MRREPAVFCFDLMNEQVVPVGRRKDASGRGGVGGPLRPSSITLDQGGRPRPNVARQWVHTLASAIHRHDRRHLITVGLVL